MAFPNGRPGGLSHVPLAGEVSAGALLFNPFTGSMHLQLRAQPWTASNRKRPEAHRHDVGLCLTFYS